MTRREFALWSVAAGANLAIAALLLVPGLSYLLGPVLRAPRGGRWLGVGPAQQFRGGAVHRVRLESESGEGYARTRRELIVFVTELDGRLVAFDSECTHMGCNVTWTAGRGQFECPCHGGVFGITGAVAGGPPKTPLRRYRLRVERGQLQLELGSARA